MKFIKPHGDGWVCPIEERMCLSKQYLVLLKKLPAEDTLSPEELDLLLRPLA
jgi:hypothetical protein